jgi:hypothetical protein
MAASPTVEVRELRWNEIILGEIDFPREKLSIAAGFGSGLTSKVGDLNGQVWAICDRGPNLKLKEASERYGWSAPSEYLERDGAKLMPRPEIGPALALLRTTEDEVLLQRTVRITTAAGLPVSGLPIPASGHANCEPVLDLEGRPVPPDPTGMDTEGVALLSDGSFWASEEYGPSLIRIGAGGELLERLVPDGVHLEDAGCPVRAILPAIAGQRHLNRGFEAVAVSPSEQQLFVAFQSPLAHPGVQDHKAARHVRIWALDPSGRVAAQYLYRFDDPASFRRDDEAGKVERGDLKVCEIVALAEHELLVLERASETSKIYRVRLSDELKLPAEHMQADTRPTIEQLSATGADLPELSKELLFSSDDWPQVGADIEGMALLDARSMLLVSDNDFGCEGKQTGFFRLRFDRDLIGPGRT